MRIACCGATTCHALYFLVQCFIASLSCLHCPVVLDLLANIPPCMAVALTRSEIESPETKASDERWYRSSLCITHQTTWCTILQQEQRPISPAEQEVCFLTKTRTDADNGPDRVINVVRHHPADTKKRNEMPALAIPPSPLPLGCLAGVRQGHIWDIQRLRNPWWASWRVAWRRGCEGARRGLAAYKKTPLLFTHACAGHCSFAPAIITRSLQLPSASARESEGVCRAATRAFFIDSRHCCSCEVLLTATRGLS